MSADVDAESEQHAAGAGAEEAGQQSATEGETEARIIRGGEIPNITCAVMASQAQR